jgi:phosphatidylglycerol:prolipoprotein diacylglycerol transferase
VFWGLIGFYGLVRFLVGWVRQPDRVFGFDVADTFPRGRVLSLPMVVVGVVMMVRGMRAGKPAAERKRKAAKH